MGSRVEFEQAPFWSYEKARHKLSPSRTLDLAPRIMRTPCCRHRHHITPQHGIRTALVFISPLNCDQFSHRRMDGQAENYQTISRSLSGGRTWADIPFTLAIIHLYPLSGQWTAAPTTAPQTSTMPVYNTESWRPASERV